MAGSNEIILFRAGLREMSELNPRYANSSLVELLVGVGFLLVYFLEVSSKSDHLIAHLL